MIAIYNHLQCRYLGSGNLNTLRKIPLADNEVLIYTEPNGDRLVLLRGFLEFIRSDEVRKKIPQQFSENDLAEVLIEMVETLLNSLLVEFDWLSHSMPKSSSDSQVVVCAILSW